MNNPFDYTPDNECDEAFRELVAELEELKRSDNQADSDFIKEIEDGKMLGVLIATDDTGFRHTLYAFSGQISDAGFFHSGFVGPVFDYLGPNGYFKRKEREISRQNLDISQFENNRLAEARKAYELAKSRVEAKIEEYKERCRRSKCARQARRESGSVTDEELTEMVRQSQFEKAELHRLKKRSAASLEPFLADLTETEIEFAAMKRKRRDDSEALQKWLFSNFKVLNARGESRSLSEIFASTAAKVPPSGAGECCAPKLLQAAYLRDWHPESIAEYWYGRPKDGEVRIHGRHYPACHGKCLPVLGWMLQGLSIDPPLGGECMRKEIREPEIIFENEWFCIVDKPSGMLSVPGKGPEVSLQQWLIDRYGDERDVKMAHRLDQDTSGLMVATFGQHPYKLMQSLFATRNVKKEYAADLEGNYESLGIPRTGRLQLPVSPDWEDRPRQRVDFETGKEAVTDYEFIRTEEYRSRITFYPHTGRTHQLRVHAASAMGLGMPIVGDRLYGRERGSLHERLRLHARKLEFTFPIDGKHYSFESPIPF